ncbi:hypothetical protein Tco_1096161, partial [Tanacetum coccineum]
KCSSNKGLNRRSNSCNDGAFVSAGGETFRTSVEIEGSLLIPFFFHLVEVFFISGYVTSATKDVKVFERRFSAFDDVIWCLFMSVDNEIASSQKNKGSLEAKSIIRAALARVQFRLLTTPFCSGVQGVEL